MPRYYSLPREWLEFTHSPFRGFRNVRALWLFEAHYGD